MLDGRDVVVITRSVGVQLERRLAFGWTPIRVLLFRLIGVLSKRTFLRSALTSISLTASFLGHFRAFSRTALVHWLK